MSWYSWVSPHYWCEYALWGHQRYLRHCHVHGWSWMVTSSTMAQFAKKLKKRFHNFIYKNHTILRISNHKSQAHQRQAPPTHGAGTNVIQSKLHSLPSIWSTLGTYCGQGLGGLGSTANNVRGYYCCDRKSRAAYAQSFAPWQQATIEITRRDHSIIACSRHIHIFLFFAHIPFVVNHTTNAATPERLQRYQWQGE